MADTVAEYLQAVDDIAKEALEEYPDDEDDRQQYVTESVDGSYWIIYYHANEVVLQASDNEPDGEEVQSMAGPDADWRQMRMFAAFMAMEADVMQEVARLVEEAELEEVEA